MTVQPAYIGLLLAALCLLGGAAYAAFRRALSRDLCTLAILGAALCASGGFALQARWELRGPLCAALSTDEALRAAQLFTSPVYLDALDLPPDAAPGIRAGIAIEPEGACARLQYRLTGFVKGPAQAAAATWAAHAAREAPGIALAARLHCARSQEDIARALGAARPVLGRPSRLVLRQLLPELRDRFPGARAELDDFGRAIGEPALQ